MTDLIVQLKGFSLTEEDKKVSAASSGARQTSSPQPGRALKAVRSTSTRSPDTEDHQIHAAQGHCGDG